MSAANEEIRKRFGLKSIKANELAQDAEVKKNLEAKAKKVSHFSPLHHRELTYLSFLSQNRFFNFLMLMVLETLMFKSFKNWPLHLVFK